MTMSNETEEKIRLPHHEQQELCTTRLPYRQGRKLTAVKVYTINNESNHLLIFGVPSLNLRQETKSLFNKFGKLLQFSVSLQHAAEPFTETFHAVYETIQSARIAKRMLDTKNFYGSSLHVCYAPEFESVQETRQKLFLRKRDVIYRLRNLEKEIVQKDDVAQQKDDISNVESIVEVNVGSVKVNMGEINVIGVGKQIRDVVLNKNKRKLMAKDVVIEKKFQPCFVSREPSSSVSKEGKASNSNSKANNTTSEKAENSANSKEIDIIDFTSTELETLTNINENLNFDKFGNEVVRNVPQKPLNRIKFHLGNKKLI